MLVQWLWVSVFASEVSGWSGTKTHLRNISFWSTPPTQNAWSQMGSIIFFGFQKSNTRHMPYMLTSSQSVFIQSVNIHTNQDEAETINRLTTGSVCHRRMWTFITIIIICPSKPQFSHLPSGARRKGIEHQAQGMGVEPGKPTPPSILAKGGGVARSQQARVSSPSCGPSFTVRDSRRISATGLRV